MAHETVETAVEARLRAAWTACPIYSGNAEATRPDDDGGFLALQFPWSETKRWSTGTKLYREEGRFRIVMSVPTGTGMATVRAWGTELAALFRDQKFGGVRCQTPGAPMTIEEGEGAFFVAAFTVPFTFNFQEA